MVAEAMKERLRAQYRTLDPVALLADIRATQEELGNRIDHRTGGALRENAGGKSDMVVHSSTAEPATFARGRGNDLARGEPVPRTDGPSGVTKNESGCRPSSTRTWR